MTLVFNIFLMFYAKTDWSDANDFSAGNPEADTVPDDDVAEKSQYQLDTEQKEK